MISDTPVFFIRLVIRLFILSLSAGRVICRRSLKRPTSPHLGISAVDLRAFPCRKVVFFTYSEHGMHYRCGWVTALVPM